jgi:hypothetical protein
VQQPRILIVDSEGATALPYARLSARLQPLDVRVETTLDKALGTLSRDTWDLGVVTARSGPSADVLYGAIRKADPQLPVVIKGDARVQYEKVIEVLDLVGKLEITQLGLVTQRLTR